MRVLHLLAYRSSDSMLGAAGSLTHIEAARSAPAPHTALRRRPRGAAPRSGWAQSAQGSLQATHHLQATRQHGRRHQERYQSPSKARRRARQPCTRPCAASSRRPQATGPLQRRRRHTRAGCTAAQDRLLRSVARAGGCSGRKRQVSSGRSALARRQHRRTAGRCADARRRRRCCCSRGR